VCGEEYRGEARAEGMRGERGVWVWEEGMRGEEERRG
jgi:hypothetical protein